jgi:type I restriction enzyme S subunit
MASGWRELPLKHSVYINPEVLPEEYDPSAEIEYVDIGNVDQIKGICSTERMYFADAPSRARRVVRHGDSIVSTVRTYLKAVAQIRHPPANMIVSTGFAVLRSRPCAYPGFIGWTSQSEDFVQRVVANSTGVSYPAINPSALGCLPVKLPSLDEQQTIADFLDRETARIDELIAKKERLADVLQEEHRAMLSKLLTKGVDGERLAPTGLSWYGCSPEHWTRASLSRLCKLQRGHDLPQQERFDGEVPIVSSSGISGFHNRAAARGPGVVTGRYGTIGRAFYLESDYWPLNTTLYVIAFNGNNPKFVRYVLELVPLASDSEKSAVPGINRNYVHTLGVAIPPKSEQVEIVAAIEQLESKHRSKVAMIGSATERLREYRTALVSAAVTGQIDVGSYRKEPEAVMEAS